MRNSISEFKLSTKSLRAFYPYLIDFPTLVSLYHFQKLIVATFTQYTSYLTCGELRIKIRFDLSIISKFSNIQQGVVIGSDGFGFALNSDDYRELRHLGRVLIGKNVKIGSNSCIDRGTLNDTKIGNNVRIDNLVHIAHNVIIGNNCVIAGQTGIAGSTIIGENVIMGGQVGISGHLNIGDNVKIAAKSGVIKNISDNIIVGGYPAQKIKDWHRGTIKLYKKND